MIFTNKKGLLCLMLSMTWLLLCGFNTSENKPKAEKEPTKAESEKQAENQKEQEEWEDRVLANVDDYVNVREEANTDAIIVGRLFDGDGGYILEKEDGWTKIRSGNVEGYVNNDYLFFGEKAYQKAQDKLELTATVNTTGLRIRYEAGTYTKILKIADEVTKYTVVS